MHIIRSSVSRACDATPVTQDSGGRVSCKAGAHEIFGFRSRHNGRESSLT